MIVTREHFPQLLVSLHNRGYQVVGPTVRESAIVYDTLTRVEDLPIGYTDEQDGGFYRLRKRADQALFGYAVGPHSWKQFLHLPVLRLWSARRTKDGFQLLPEQPPIPKLAFLGVRSCELHAIAIQDTVLLHTAQRDPAYQARREQICLIAVNCGHAGGTCFCASMQTGPQVASGFDLALTEMLDEHQHLFLVEVGTTLGAEILQDVSSRPATSEEIARAERLVTETATQMGRSMDTTHIKESLLFAIALAVGLTPEFLSMITTVTLGRGALRMAKQKVIVKHLESMQNFGSIDVLCSDKTGTLTGGAMTLDQALDLAEQASARVYQLVYLNSFYETGIRSPLDEAILQHAHSNLDAYRKQAELPFDFERRRLSVVVTSGDEITLITKGAPESVLNICDQYEFNGTAHPLLIEDRERYTQMAQHLHAQGLRVLAVASRAVPAQPAYALADEQHLVLAGFVTFADPPLPDATAALQALARDGVQVKILTGDNELVTRHVCAQVGLPVDALVLGNELDRISDTALGPIAERTHVFARVSPAQKNRIILALKRRHHVVGFLGDGINDAPSLHAADVGISVTSATDVARDAADIVLLERGLPVLHQGILEGRKAFGNVIKFLLMGTSSNFGNVFSMAGAFLFLPFLPMLPTQILLNNFLYSLAQVTIPTDRVDQRFIQKPRHWDISLIRNFMMVIGPLSSIFDFLTFFLMLSVFHANAALFHTGWFVESLATQTLVLFIIRTAGNPLRSRPSPSLALTTCLVVVIGLVLPFTPFAASLGFVPLPGLYFLFLAAMTSAYLLLVEIAKRPMMRKS